jgi:2-methylcitrate dehydratase PrpD
VHVKGSDRLQQRFPVKKAAVVTITTANDKFAGELDSPVGNPAAPLAPADLRAKFMSLATAVLDTAGAEALWTALTSIEQARDLSGVLALLSRKPQKL